jgi:hypothetical protein
MKVFVSLFPPNAESHALIFTWQQRHSRRRGEQLLRGRIASGVRAAFNGTFVMSNGSYTGKYTTFTFQAKVRSDDYAHGRE